MLARHGARWVRLGTSKGRYDVRAPLSGRHVHDVADAAMRAVATARPDPAPERAVLLATDRHDHSTGTTTLPARPLLWTLARYCLPQKLG